MPQHCGTSLWIDPPLPTPGALTTSARGTLNHSWARHRQQEIRSRPVAGRHPRRQGGEQTGAAMGSVRAPLGGRTVEELRPLANSWREPEATNNLRVPRGPADGLTPPKF